MDLNTHLLINHRDYFIASRLESAGQYKYGSGSPITAMIAATAAGIRRGAAAIERWARGSSAEVVDYRLPRMNSAR